MEEHFVLLANETPLAWFETELRARNALRAVEAVLLFGDIATRLRVERGEHGRAAPHLLVIDTVARGRHTRASRRR